MIDSFVVLSQEWDQWGFRVGVVDIVEAEGASLGGLGASTLRLCKVTVDRYAAGSDADAALIEVKGCLVSFDRG